MAGATASYPPATLLAGVMHLRIYRLLGASMEVPVITGIVGCAYSGRSGAGLGGGSTMVINNDAAAPKTAKQIDSCLIRAKLQICHP